MNEKIKILFVTDEMEVGGTQRQMVNLIKNMDSRQFDIDLLYFTNWSELVEEVRPYCGRVIELKKKSKFDIKFVFKLIKLLLFSKYNIVHAYSLSGEAWVAVVRRLLFGRFKLVSSIRSMHTDYTKSQWKVKRFITQQSHAIISNSRTCADYVFGKTGLRFQGKLSVIYNGLPIVDPGIIRQGDGQKTVLFVGRLVEDKNIACLIKAAARLKDRSDIQVKIVGEGILQEPLLSLAEKFQLSNVQFLGERNDVEGLIKQSDVVVMPSIQEGISNVILEAMMIGVPVVASNVGGTPEIITHDVNGLLFESDDDRRLAEIIESLVYNEPDKRRLSRNAYDRVCSSFSIPEMVKQTQAIYFDLLGKPTLQGKLCI